MSDTLQVVVIDVAERLSDTLLALAHPGPRQALDLAAERLLEVASDLQDAARESTEPDHPGWATAPTPSEPP